MRLREMGVEPGLLAASVNCIVAQRLARRLCADCRIPYAATGKDLADPTFGIADDAPITLYRAGHCVRCSNSGYRGRVALYEVLLMQESLRPLMHGSTQEIFAAAVQNGMRTLRQDGLRLCLAGVSSLDEVTRVTGERT
jgi:type II secretory ATPase GspE/PulE/Tfp pilus assembly ATPase PilB-like protein